MTENRDLVPPLVLYKDREGAYHTQDKVCAYTTSQALREAPQSTLQDEMRHNPRILVDLCSSDQCQRVLDRQWAQGARSVEMHLSNLQIDVSSGLQVSFCHQATMALEMYERTRDPRNPLGPYTDHVWDKVKNLLDVHAKTMRTQEWRDKLLGCTLGHIQNSALREVLDAAGGDSTTLGLMLGPRDVGERTLGDTFLADVLREDHPGDPMVVIAPMGILELLLHEGPKRRVGYEGHRQVILLPPDLTPELLETLRGVYAPESGGDMMSLPEALHAARLLLEH